MATIEEARKARVAAEARILGFIEREVTMLESVADLSVAGIHVRFTETTEMHTMGRSYAVESVAIEMEPI